MCLCDHQPNCQGQSWAVLTSLIENRKLRFNLHSFTNGSASVNSGSFPRLSAPHYFCLLPSQIKGTDDFCQPSDAVWQMSQHLLSPWFIGLEWPQPRGRTHQKGQAVVSGSCWMPTPPPTFIPSLSGPYILLLVIVWPSAVFQTSLTTPLSKHERLCQILSPSSCPTNSTLLCLFREIKRWFIWQKSNDSFCFDYVIFRKFTWFLLQRFSNFLPLAS